MEQFVHDWLLDPTVGRFVAAVVGLIVLTVLTRFVQKLLGRYIRNPDNRYRARKFVKVLGYITAVLILAIIFSDRLGGLTVAFGVAGAGIAFALQEVIASVAGWLAISFANFYKTGDRVQLGGIKGDVIDISILRTTLMECGEWVDGDLYNGRVVRIANSFIFKEPVFNYSGDFPFLWDEIKVPIKFGSDHRLARSLLQRVADDVVGEFTDFAARAWEDLVRQYLIENARVDPMITMIANDNWIEFTVRYVVDYKRRRITKDQLFSRILEEIEATGGRVALASTTLQLVDLPGLQVQISDARPGRTSNSISS
jgi:small-conductance mechanosensitive channel